MSRACSRTSPRCWRGTTFRSSRWSRRGSDDQARLVMVVHPVLESRFNVAMSELADLEVLRAPPRAIRVLEEEFG